MPETRDGGMPLCGGATMLKVALAGSGGGHVRQLLDLEPAWSPFDTVFITEPTALGQSLPSRRPVAFVAHYSFGQARLGAPLKMLASAWRNLADTVRALRTHRPDVIVTTGAGAVFLPALLGKLFGAELIVIESFARFDKPSLFGRMIGPFADAQIVQSSALQAAYPKAKLFDPFRMLSSDRPAKESLIFATVGATLAFPRLTETVVALKRQGLIAQRVIVQTGSGGRVPGEDPKGLEQVETLPFEAVQKLLKTADIVITHGGTGSLITALREGCHVIAMPRRFALKEHYDDHQSQIVTAFGQRGLLQEADDADTLITCLAKTETRTPAMATSDPQALIAWLHGRLEELAAQKASRGRRTSPKFAKAFRRA